MSNFINMDTAEMFISANCNLSCRYCYISKNDSILKLDKKVINAIKDGTYLQALKRAFPDPKKLKKMELWGGEPLLGIKVMSDHIREYFDYFPNLNYLYLSTNFTYHVEDLILFLLKLSELDREITVEVQISLDGPKPVTMINRGEKVNELVETNLTMAAQSLSEINLHKAKIIFKYKSTLSIDNIDYLLERINIIEYFNYFNDIAEKFNYDCINKNVTFKHGSVPNFVVPGQYTSEDGGKFFRFIRALEDTYHYCKSQGLLPNYSTFNFLNNNVKKAIAIYTQGFEKINLGFCGGLKSKAAVLYDGNIMVCHRAFFDYHQAYRDRVKENNDLYDRKVMYTPSSLVEHAARYSMLNHFNRDEITKIDRRMEFVYNYRKFQLGSIMANICELAHCGQVDSIYLQDEELLIKSALVVKMYPNCLYDNILTTGSFYLRDLSIVRLLCKGALEYMFNKTIPV